jgi:D-glycero-alpha-D-manno-heptose-7-phosphate kinase
MGDQAAILLDASDRPALSKADAAGAWGGKLCGAGGGGFLLFLAPPERHQAIIGALGLRHVPIRVGVKGCEVVYAST